MKTPVSSAAHEPGQRSARDRRVQRPWRIAFVVYTLLLFTATHWPHLDIGSEGRPAADKLIHLYAFGGFAFLLWRTGWIRSRWLLLMVGAAYTVFDELTQAVPLLGREFSRLDVIASMLGVVNLVVWLAALQPIGGRANRLRLRAQSFTFEELFTQWRCWILATIAAIPIGFAVLFIWPIVFQNMYEGWPQLLYAAGHLVWLGTMGVIWLKWWEHERARLYREARCMACGASCREVKPDEQGAGACATCGEVFHVGQWLEPVGLPEGSQRRSMMFAAGTAVAMIIVLTIGAFVLSFLARRIVQTSQLPFDLINSIDLTILSLATAFGGYLLRRAFARATDQQGAFCRRCGHDLRATATERGIGRCGECGTAFARGIDVQGSPASTDDGVAIRG